MTKYNWTTDKGAKVELVISDTTALETVDVDWNITANRTEKQVDEFKINGQSYAARLGRVNCTEAIRFQVGGRDAAVIIPEEIKNQIWAKEIAEIKASIKADAEYQEHYNAVKRAITE